MKKIVFIFVLMISMLSFAQEKENYKEASKQFMEYYNNTNYEAIFNMFADNYFIFYQ